MTFDFYKAWLIKVDNLETAFGRNKIVLVIGNVPYHCKRLDRIPTSVDTKETLSTFRSITHCYTKHRGGRG
ncbi:unnamed protein product [Enterobius vermicularis]|uniref:DDE-1 domain-containing protein n=1 Tax=Enterobius vermicularis TaxID=51028 RepID=A0A0N4UVF6_ENTVE|nr:unnamed protein product [Enterobius vermicularis]